MNESFDNIRNGYAEMFRKHGVSSDAMYMPKGRHEIRYRPLLDYLFRNPDCTVLDYGCGLGYLLEYILESDIQCDYQGVDFVAEFINSCRSRLGAHGRFDIIDPKAPLSGTYDFVFASGVFNLATSSDQYTSLTYVKERISELFNACKNLLIVDFLSPHVDFSQDGAQHVDYREIVDWFVPKLTRRWMIRHDLLPYEYTLILYRNDVIVRPENIFESI